MSFANPSGALRAAQALARLILLAMFTTACSHSQSDADLRGSIGKYEKSEHRRDDELTTSPVDLETEELPPSAADEAGDERNPDSHQPLEAGEPAMAEEPPATHANPFPSPVLAQPVQSPATEPPVAALPNPHLASPPQTGDLGPEEPLLAPLPHPRDGGVCSFEPRPDPQLLVDNPNCPDGVFRGRVSLDNDAAVEALRGCVRISGSVYVDPAHLTSLRALHGLRVIEGNVSIASDLACAPTCRPAAEKLSNLEGLDELRCISGDLYVDMSLADAPIDFSGLHNLVEVGRDLNIWEAPVASRMFASLRRVWGSVTLRVPVPLPRLETVYGTLTLASNPPPGVYVGCSGEKYCRDGVLGCSARLESNADVQRLSNCEVALGLVLDPTLTDLSPLAKLRRVGSVRYLNGVTGAESVQTLAPFPTLESAGSLYVSALPHLKNFDALSTVAFDSSVQLEYLPELDGLGGLAGTKSLADLKLARVPSLHDLSGLDSLESAGRIYVEDSPGLQSLSGAPRLRTLGGIELYWVHALEDISLLSQLSSTSVVFYALSSLTDLTPLRNVRLTDVRLEQMLHLETLDGLQGTHDDVRWIAIHQNQNLHDISALHDVTHAEYVEVTYNPVLQSLDGLDQLVSLDQSSGISNNAMLPQCEVDALHARIPQLTGSNNDLTATCAR